MCNKLKFSTIQELATEYGLRVFAAINKPDLSSEHARLKLWQEQGYAAQMQFMQRPADLFTNANNFLPNTSAIISFAINYSALATANECPTGYGRIARYAWGHDYHIILAGLLKKLADEIKRILPNANSRVYTDAVPLLERAIAAQANLGFIGKNTMLIRPRIGSLFFLAELLLDVQIEDLPDYSGIKKNNCGSCQRCIDICPTKAFIQPYVLDAGRCISYLTIEKRGELNLTEQAAIGDWVFGCDVCQEVCPFNHSVLKRNQEYLDKFMPFEFIQNGLIDLKMILSIADSVHFKKVFGQSAIMRTKRAGLIRNALCVAANQNAFELIPNIISFTLQEADLLLKKQALVALFRLSKKCDNPERVAIVNCINSFSTNPIYDLNQLSKELSDEL